MTGLGAYPRPAVAVDLVVLTILDAILQLLVIRRGEPPQEGMLALPGGFVRVGHDAGDQGEDLEAAAARELSEETGLAEGTVFLEQLFTFGAAGRDPRGRVISVAYYALVRPTLAPLVRAGGDAAEARWLPVAELDGEEIAFDHQQILKTALERIRGKLDYTDIAFELVPETFTIAELRAVHEVIKGVTYDPGNFRRRVLRMQTDGVLEKAPGRRITGKRPASVYRFCGRAPAADEPTSR